MKASGPVSAHAKAMVVVLVRHAKSSRDDPSWDDRDRPLAPRGIAQAAELGGWLGRAGLVPDRVLVSPAVRAVGTWQGVASAAGWNSVPMVVEPALYPGAPEAIRATLAALPASVRNVVVVGHNPDCPDGDGWKPGYIDVARSRLYIPIGRDFPTIAPVMSVGCRHSVV
ncbi:MAG: SixA phosphatase family protein [Armatimonadota bacterium]